MPEKATCDIIGVLAFVGRVQRSKKKGELLNLKVSVSVSMWRVLCSYAYNDLHLFYCSIHTDHGEDFWSYRWIHIADGTSEQPFIVQLFSTSQPEVFENICPCTQSFYLFIVRNSSKDFKIVKWWLEWWLSG